MSNADYLKRRTKILAQKAEYSRANPDIIRARNLWNKYRITQSNIDLLLKKQKGCGVCHTQDPGPRGWCVDHDHGTDFVRGILCGKCNQSLGLNGDTLENIQQTYNNQILYLQHAQTEYDRMLQIAEDAASLAPDAE